MMNRNKNNIVTYEFGTLCIEGQNPREGDTLIDKVTFDNLWNFILSSKVTEDADVVMSVHTRGGKPYIKLGRYVGTIQTKNGKTIEILPKIYKAGGKQEENKEKCRKVFLNMLKHFTDIKARSFQNASLSTKKDFPILEVYISNYIDAVEQLVLGGLKKNYAPVEENQRFLKGRLDIARQITKNITNKARFAIRYNKYIEDIPQNRVVVTTLRKLMGDSHSATNKAHISTLLTLLADIPSSQNIEQDLKIALSKNRLFSSYERLMQWSSQFLLNKGFTTFSGDCVNQSLLFQTEKLFEDFIAYLFRRFALTFKVHAQNTKYFLVDRHKDSGMFRLRPDIFVESESNPLNYACAIIDTKWKAIDSTKPNKGYLIDIKDMYQMYAYGQKYKHGQSAEQDLNVIPNLVLIYPYTEKFTEKLPDFIYEELKNELGLKVMVVPFDLSEPSTYENQIHNIINSFSVKEEQQPVYRYTYNLEESIIPMHVAESEVEGYTTRRTMLVGCYKSAEHLEWIKKNKLYNIRLGDRRGAVDNSGCIVSAHCLLLYSSKNVDEYEFFELEPSNQIYAQNTLMKSLDYPDLKPDREYVLYKIKGSKTPKHAYKIEELKKKYAPKLKKWAPFYVDL